MNCRQVRNGDWRGPIQIAVQLSMLQPLGRAQDRPKALQAVGEAEVEVDAEVEAGPGTPAAAAVSGGVVQPVQLSQPVGRSRA